jgi:hypothetical protein
MILYMFLADYKFWLIIPFEICILQPFIHVSVSKFSRNEGNEKKQGLFFSWDN